MRLRLLVLLCIGLLCIAGSSFATLLDFENLTPKDDISGTYYEDLYWEYGNAGYLNVTGSWLCPQSSSSGDFYHCPNSGSRNLINSWGCTEIGIQFLADVDVFGAYFAGQGYIETWAEAVRVSGYRDGEMVGQTNWFTDIDQHPDWFAINLTNVDRIVIEAKPTYGYTYGWYGLDDLTFKVIPEPATLILLSLGGLALCRKRTARS